MPSGIGRYDADQRDLIGAGGYRSALVEQVGQTVLELATAKSRGLPACCQRVVEDEAAVSVAVTLATRIDRETEEIPDRVREHWTQCLVRLAQNAGLFIPSNSVPACAKVRCVGLVFASTSDGTETPRAHDAWGGQTDIAKASITNARKSGSHDPGPRFPPLCKT